MADFETESAALPPLVREKLAAFDQIQTDFESGFHFVQEVHGQRRFESFPIPTIVRYLRALWVCDLKDRLLSVPHTIERYEGRRALTVLLAWQEGDDVSVVDFLQAKLDMLSYGQITRQLREAHQSGDAAWMQRLTHGRHIMLNRSQNLNAALFALFALSPDALTEAAREACAHHGLTPDEIRQRLAELEEPIYSPWRHQALAQRNMVVMNAVGVHVTDNSADRPGQRTERVEIPTIPRGPYAEHSIIGEIELIAPAYGTDAYMPRYQTSPMVLNNPAALLEPTGEIERHPVMS